MSRAVHNPTPVTGYSEGVVVSEVAPIACTETFDDDRHPNTNHYFRIGDEFFNVHPYRSDLGGYPVRWVTSVCPVGWLTREDELFDEEFDKGVGSFNTRRRAC